MAWWLQRWLVDHPAVAGFKWDPSSTAGASIPFVSVTVAAYLALTVLIHSRLLPLPAPSPALLRLLSAAHSLVLLLLSLAIATASILSARSHPLFPRSLFCFPPASPAAGPFFFWAHLFYLSKIYELLDTLLILLSGGRRLTFLHVYHHAAVVAMCYAWVAARMSLMPVAMVTNAGVHVVMYAYYFCCGVGWRWRPRWKRAVTELQICQFCFSFAASVAFLWFHFVGGGCEGAKVLAVNAVFNISLLALFLDFHSAAYRGGAAGRSAGEKEA